MTIATKRAGLRQILLAAVLVPVLVLVLLVAALLLRHHLLELQWQLQQQALNTSGLAASLGATALRDDNADLLQQIASNALEQPGLRQVRILDRQQRPLATAGNAPLPAELVYDGRIREQIAGDLYHITRPIYSGNNVAQQLQDGAPPQLLGWVEVSYYRHSYLLSRHHALIGTAAAVFAALLIAVVIAMIAYHRLTRSLYQLRQGVRSLAEGDYEVDFATDGWEETRLLAESLNEASETIKRSLRELQGDIEQSHEDLRETLETIEIQNVELELARREAVEASRVKSEFLANTSHEIRTPLHGIIGFSNILLKSEQDPRRRESLEMIHYSATNLLNIINDILDFSKLEANKLVLDQLPINLRSLAEEVLQMLSATCQDKDLELVLFADPQLPPTLIADQLRLRQILTNLISNAIKFTDRGFVSIRLHLNAVNNGEADVSIEINDSGPGLSDEQQKRIFQPFSQADASTSRKFGGTGLGLIIVKRLVEHMGGEVDISSKPGAGATFWVRLRLPVVTDAAPPRDFTRLRGRHVTVCEKDDLSRTALERQLKEWGLKVRHCSDPAKLCGDSADVMILGADRHMVKELHHYDTLRSIPLLVLAPPQYQHLVEEQVRCLPKPTAHLKLFDTLCEFLLDQPTLDKGAQDPRQRRFPGLRVLTVDDNPINQRVAGAMLEDFQVDVSYAGSGSEALQLARQHRYALILLDLQMPDMDGVETARQLRRLPECRDTRLVALSAYVVPDNPAQLWQAGISSYLGKPLSEEQLAALLADVADGHRGGDPERTARLKDVDVAECLALTHQRSGLARDMLSMMLASIPETMREIHETQAAGDTAHMAEITHRLKGSCCYLGLPRLRQALEELQAARPAPGSAAPEVQLRQLLEALERLQDWQRRVDLDTLFATESQSSAP